MSDKLSIIFWFIDNTWLSFLQFPDFVIPCTAVIQKFSEGLWIFDALDETFAENGLQIP